MLPSSVRKVYLFKAPANVLAPDNAFIVSFEIAPVMVIEPSTRQVNRIMVERLPAAVIDPAKALAVSLLSAPVAVIDPANARDVDLFSAPANVDAAAKDRRVCLTSAPVVVREPDTDCR